MEEKNKRKKALLAKTIAEKSKQTRAETMKLQRIQKELQTLDDMVSNDISILRGRIEQASWDYTTARKRYEKAEAEFVAAKLELHKKTELKEQLTEHLCAIIQQNELRKAQKLEELMARLELQADDHEDEEKDEEKEEKEEKKEEEETKETEEETGEGDKEDKETEQGAKEENLSSSPEQEPKPKDGETSEAPNDSEKPERSSS
ncbi:hypothetical protein NL108_017454 [Boleophthalmus pectinirostris]|nr:hypothetical protein NL108_017454 [Boleophthalmus pectinirostris]